MMTQKDDDLDNLIQEELDRISQEVLEWDAEASGGKSKAHWKPRSSDDQFVYKRNKQIIPKDKQVYEDLQLSRGACIPQDPDGKWLFPDPAEGMGKYFERNSELWGHLQSFIPLSPNMHILEVGVRTGQFMHFLNSSGFKNVYGIDCVKLNVLLCQKNGLQNVLHLDAHELSSAFDDESKDLICSYHCLEHCYNPIKVLQECNRCLKPGGGIHIEVPLKDLGLDIAHCYSFKPGELRNMIKSLGLNVLDVCKEAGNERIVAVKKSH